MDKQAALAMSEAQPTQQSEPAQQQLVTNLETLKVLSDALRSRILDFLRAEALTVKQLAALLKLSPKKLYYHINLMEQHGLIRVVQTRIVSGILEKTYRATAYLFLFDDEVFASAPNEPGSLPPGMALLFDTTKTQLDQSLENKLVELGDDAPFERRLLLRWKLSRMAPDKAAAFYARLEALLEEFEAMELDPTNAEGNEFRLFCSLFPVRRHRRRQTQSAAPDEPSQLQE